jgi:hypothetical protein
MGALKSLTHVLAGCALLRRCEAGLLHDLAPTDHFGLHKCLQLVERSPPDRVDTEIDELLLDLGAAITREFIRAYSYWTILKRFR